MVDAKVDKQSKMKQAKITAEIVKK